LQGSALLFAVIERDNEVVIAIETARPAREPFLMFQDA